MMDVSEEKPRKNIAQNSPKLKWWDVVLLVIPIGIILFGAYAYLRDRANFALAETAFDQGDCQTALDALETVRNDVRLLDTNNIEDRANDLYYDIYGECAHFVDGLKFEANQYYSGALVKYAEYLDNRPMGRFAPDVRDRIRAIWTEQPLTTLVDSYLCENLAFIIDGNAFANKKENLPQLLFNCTLFSAKAQDINAFLTFYESYANDYGNTETFKNEHPQMANALWNESGTLKYDDDLCANAERLNEQNIFTNRDEELPTLLKACAEYYATRKMPYDEVAMYQLYLDEFPDASDSVEITDLVANIFLEQAEAVGAEGLDQPPAYPIQGLRGSQIYITNASEYTVTVSLTGPKSYVEEIPPCTTCGKVTTECPLDAPYIVIDLQAGKYTVVASASTASTTSTFGRYGYITPFTGVWTLSRGNAYDTCFYVETTNR